ncbi:MAG: NAD(P)(+) transhydrogenase (Re/Si-specific) subunit beta, partial [Gallionella sp.]
MSANSVALAYLAAAVLFILTLKGLSSPVTARRGNMFGMVGMAIAVLTTLSVTHNVTYILIAIAAGGSVGAIIAKRIQMTAMPELVAAMHSLVGLAAVLIAMAAFNNPAAYGIGATLHASNRIELFIGTFVGAITFT